MIPELAGNPFVPALFKMYDQDGDGYIDASDMRALLESLTKLADKEERYRCKRKPMLGCQLTAPPDSVHFNLFARETCQQNCY